MALIKLDPIVDKISGKVGGQSFVAGTNGNYIRNNAQTRKGTLNQGYQSKTKTPGVNATWQKLTNAEKQTFIDLVGTYTYTNRIDEVRQYSAYQIFMLCAQGTQLINESIQFSGSTFVTINKPLIEVFVNGPASMTVEILNPQSGIYYAIYATSPQNVGVYSVRRNLRYLGFVTEAVASNIFDISAIYDTKFNAILPDRNYGIMVKPIVLNSGQIGVPSNIEVVPFEIPPAIPNTIIGGLGASVTTASALEIVLGLNPGDISYFNLVGSQIECIIDVTYFIPGSAFKNNTDITSYIDIVGLITTITRNVFENSTIEEGVFPNVTLIRGDFATAGAFYNTTNLVSLVAPNVTTITAYAFRYSGLTAALNMPLLETIGREVFQNCSAFLGFSHSLDNLTSLGISAFLNCISLPSFSSTSLTTLNTTTYVNCTSLNSINLPNVTLINGVRTFQNCKALLSVNLPSLLTIIDSTEATARGIFWLAGTQTFTANNATYIGAQSLGLSSAMDVIELSSCTDLGGTVGNDNVFNGLKLNCTITVPVALQTNNGGNPDGDLQYAVASRNATIIYV